MGRLLPGAVLAAAVIAVLVVAFGQLGGATSSARTERENVTAATGVVQSTVTGTGNLEPVTEEDVSFQTSGTLSHVDVAQGERVHKGELLATLSDGAAKLTLAGARATLAAARKTLSSDRATLADEDTATTEDTSYVTTTTQSATTSTTASPTPTTTSPGTTRTAPAATTSTETTATQSTPAATTTSAQSSSSSSNGSSSTVTTATIDSDELAVLNDAATVRTDAAALAETKLRAPVSGTITTLDSLTAGDSVSAGSDSSASSGSSDSTSSSSTGASGSTGAGASSSSSTGSTSSSSSSFAVIDSLRHLSMSVTVTESDIGKLHVGEPATVSLDALSGVELAAKVTSVSSLGTTDSDVVSYTATLTLEQHDSRVKPGMSASASIVVGQGHGVTVPSDAVTGTGTLATVTESVNGRDTTRKVIVGTRGDSRDLIVSGLKAGAELVVTETLPSEGSSAQTSTSSSGSSAASALGGSRSSGGTSGGFGAGGAPSGGGGPP